MKHKETKLKTYLKSRGTKLTWLEESLIERGTAIHYQRLRRIVEGRFPPTVHEARAIAAVLQRPMDELFEPTGVKNAYA